jgi:hypothetical protein
MKLVIVALVVVVVIVKSKGKCLFTFGKFLRLHL